MHKLFRNFIAVATLIGSPFTAHAYLIDNDQFTTDTMSRLDWLDVTASTNRTYDYVKTQFAAGGEFEGYRYATSAELLTLLGNAKDTSYEGGVTEHITLPEVDSYGAADIILSLLGITSSTDPGAYVNYSWGLIADPRLSNPYETWTSLILSNDRPEAEYLDYVHLHRRHVGKDQHTSPLGSFLVRDTFHSDSSVPEPPVLALLALGLFGIGFTRKQYNR